VHTSPVFPITSHRSFADHLGALSFRGPAVTIRKFSPVPIRADVIRLFHERGDEGMVEVLAELEADELLGPQLAGV
jgi:hypothetical protein